MSDLKTQPTAASVAAFLKSIEDPRRRAECETVKKMMGRVTGHRAKMWGDSIVGYGRYHYKYASGREGDFFLTGFSPRKAALTVYMVPGFKPCGSLMKKLGKHKHSSSCLYLTRLENVDLDVLEKLVTKSVELMRKRYPA